jgi:hypothetical protein
MFPVAGHVLRVAAPWVGNTLADSRSRVFLIVLFTVKRTAYNNDDILKHPKAPKLESRLKKNTRGGE